MDTPLGYTTSTTPDESRRAVHLESVLDPRHIKHPIVSVIVTSFNYASYIEACLGSIAVQSYRHFECIVVDDNSTDGSVALIDAYTSCTLAAGRFRLVRHARNEGQMAAFQTGLQHATGSFVVFVDADDLLFPDFIEAHLKAHLNSSRAAAFTNSELLQIGSDGQVLSGIQGMSGAPDLRASRGADGHRWVFSATGGMTLKQTELPLRYYWPREIDAAGWIWSTTSATMFRRAVVDLVMSAESRCLRICADRYLFNFSHALGGSWIVRSVHGCYRRHSRNGFASNPVVGGDSFLGDNRKDPNALSNDLIFRHVLEHFEQFSCLLGRGTAIWLLRHFGPPGRVAKAMALAKALYRIRIAGHSQQPTSLRADAPVQLTAAHAMSVTDERK